MDNAMSALHYIRIIRIILFAIISQSHGEILRLKCATYANFSVEENNRKLESTFLTLHGLDTPQCQSECSLNKRCKTININEDELICELNDKSSEDVKDNVTTVAGVGWTYYSTRYNETLVGRYCNEMNPCGEGWKCYDQCDCPGYYCKEMKSCLDWYHAGTRATGIYSIMANTSYPVFCDFESELNSVWTLVMSFSRRNRESFHNTFEVNDPKSEISPNAESYRLGLTRMRQIRSSSTMWRATCSYATYKSDIYRDYVRAQLKEIDILEYKGEGGCHLVEFIDIRGNKGWNTTVPFWQGSYPFHTDSSEKRCQFNGRTDCLPNEDNFGFYSVYNTAFRCTETDESTTQYWFGRAISHINNV